MVTHQVEEADRGALSLISTLPRYRPTGLQICGVTDAPHPEIPNTTAKALQTFDPKTALDHIDIDQLVKVTLDLANIDSPTGNEGPVADYVHDWLTREGFHARKVGLYPDRPNVIATLPGRGEGRSLC